MPATPEIAARKPVSVPGAIVAKRGYNRASQPRVRGWRKASAAAHGTDGARRHVSKPQLQAAIAGREAVFD